MIDNKEDILKVLRREGIVAEQEQVELTPISSLTNRVYLVQTPRGRFIAKWYLKVLDQFVNRDTERLVIKFLEKQGEYPRIYYSREECRIEQFVEGKVATPDDLGEKQLLELASKMAHFSKTFTESTLLSESSCNVSSRQIPELFLTFAKISESQQQKCPHIVAKCGQWIQQIFISQYEQKLQEVVKGIPLLWSHNDCNLNNIILRNNGSLLLLDYEFSATNYAGFDLGNFFNEYTTNYEANSFEINSERQLSDSLQQEIVRAYFTQLQFPGDIGLWRYYVSVGRMLSHLLWLFVGLKQIDEPIAIDMLYYVRRRKQEFIKWYQKVVGTQAAEENTIEKGK